MSTGVKSWSQTAANNDDADSTVNWAEGMAPSAINNSARAQMASVAKYRDDTAGSLETGGTTTDYTLTTNQVFASLTEMSGQELTVRFDQANGATPTLNVDTLGAKAIRINASTAVPTGFIAAGSIWRVTYDNSIPAFILNGVANVISVASVTTTGDVTVGDDLSVAGDAAVTGNGTVGGTLGVTGNVSINTDKFTVAASSGNTAVAGTLAVTGASTLTGALTANNSEGVTSHNTAKAYAKFTQSGTDVSFTASTQGFNVASITRTGVGVYDVVFTSSLPTANYAVIGTGFLTGNVAAWVDAASRTTSGFTMTTRSSSSLAAAADVIRCDFFVFGF